VTYIAPVPPQTIVAYIGVDHCKSMPQGAEAIIPERGRWEKTNK